MGERITKVHFAQSCIRIGRFAAQWGADSLDLLDDLEQAEKPEDVFRFTDEMRRRLRYLDECAGLAHPSNSSTRQPHAGNGGTVAGCAQRVKRERYDESRDDSSAARSAVRA